MNTDTVKSVTNTDLLQLMFIGLKLGHAIDWSWWWVMMPTIVYLALLTLTEVIKRAAQ